MKLTFQHELTNPTLVMTFYTRQQKRRVGFLEIAFSPMSHLFLAMQ